MRHYKYILFLLLIIASCRQNNINNLEGYWRRDFNAKVENQFFPYELYFTGDSLYMVDGYNFNHRTNFFVKDDTLKLKFSNGNEFNIEFSIVSDSTFLFGEENFYRVSSEYFTTVPSYELICFKTNELLSGEGYTSIIHLIKSIDKTQVLLNDMTVDLKYIPEFLEHSYNPPPPISLYLGKGINFKDLVEAYKWIELSGIQRVTLVTGHSTFEEFYIMKDYFIINDSLMAEFLEHERIPHPPPFLKECNQINRIAIEIRDTTDFEKLKTIIDSTDYLIQVDEQIDLLEYFELIKRIENKQNIKKEIKGFTKSRYN